MIEQIEKREPTEVEVAAYIAELAGQLSAMAKQARLLELAAALDQAVGRARHLAVPPGGGAAKPGRSARRRA